ncbi:MAG: malate dehydrogenase, partial [Gammaproteobacteria bacterium]
GRVGESTAQALAREQLCRELALLGRDEEAARGVALDLQETASLYGFDTRIVGGADPALLAGSDLVIVTAGAPRQPGQSRLDLLETNRRVVEGIVDQVRRHAPEALLLMVTNPVDVFTYLAWRRSGWERRRVFGLSGVLDSARMAAFVAEETGLSVRDVTALVIGGHGDAMVPLVRYSQVGGVPLELLLSGERLQAIVERTRRGGAEILALKKTSSAYDAPAAAIAAMVDAVARNRRRILPCVAVLEGEYGERDLALGVPAVLGAGGMERVVELPLEAEERAMLQVSIDQVREALAGLAAREAGAGEEPRG